MKTIYAIMIAMLLSVANVAGAIEHHERINKYIAVYENTQVGDYSVIKSKIKYLMSRQNLKINSVDLDCFARVVNINSQVFGLDPDVIISVIFVESAFNPTAKGDGIKSVHKKKTTIKYWSFGPMQVHMKYWGDMLNKAGICHSELLTYKYGTLVGCYILNHKINKHGLHLGLARYNGSAVYSRKVLHITKTLKYYEAKNAIRDSHRHNKIIRITS